MFKEGNIDNISGNKKEQKEIPTTVDAIYVLFHGEPQEELSFDAKTRALAGIEFLRESPESKIYFVGGGVSGGQESGAEKMKQYANEKLKDERQIEILKTSNNTAFNIEEIIENQIEKGNSNIVIISSGYHLDRIRELCVNAGMQATILPAEDLLSARSGRHATLMNNYVNSFDYHKKELMEKAFLLYIKIDPNEKVIEKIRNITRK